MSVKKYQCIGCDGTRFVILEIKHEAMVRCAQCGNTYAVGMCNTNGLKLPGKGGATT